MSSKKKTVVLSPVAAAMFAIVGTASASTNDVPQGQLDDLSSSHATAATPSIELELTGIIAELAEPSWAFSPQMPTSSESEYFKKVLLENVQ